MFGIAPTFSLFYYPYLSWVSHSYAHTQIQAPFLNVIQCMYHKLSRKCSLSKLFIKTGGSRNSVSVDSSMGVFCDQCVEVTLNQNINEVTVSSHHMPMLVYGKTTYQSAIRAL